MIQNKKQKIIIFWVLISFFTLLIFYLWLSNFKQLVEKEKESNGSEPLLQIKEDLAEAFGEAKKNIDEAKVTEVAEAIKEGLISETNKEINQEEETQIEEKEITNEEDEF